MTNLFIGDDKQLFPSVVISNVKCIFKEQQYQAMFPSIAQVGNQTIIAFRIAGREPALDPFCKPPQQHLHPRSFIALGNLDSDLNFNNFRIFSPDILAADQDPNLFALSDDKVLLTSFSWRPAPKLEKDIDISSVLFEKTSDNTGIFWGSFSSVSKDYGRSWSPRKYLPHVPNFPDIVPKERKWHGGRHRGQVCKLKNGNLLIGTYDRKKQKQPFECFIWESVDDGVTWSFKANIFENKDFSLAEPTLFVTPNGVVYAFMRNMQSSDKLAISFSTDNGTSWSKIQFIDVEGHPFNIVGVNNGFAFVTYALRSSNSSIRGRMLCLKSGIFQKQDLVIKSGAKTRDIGYPVSTFLGDNTILVVYYWIDDKGTRYIEATKLLIKTK